MTTLLKDTPDPQVELQTLTLKGPDALLLTDEVGYMVNLLNGTIRDTDFEGKAPDENEDTYQMRRQRHYDYLRKMEEFSHLFRRLEKIRKPSSDRR